jgi:hypothetical protein
MTPEAWSAIAAFGAIGISIIPILISIKANSKADAANALAIEANTIAKRADETNKNIARRQGIIELHVAWSTVSQINRANGPIGPDIAKASNAISLTAALWNHDVIEREILYQQYWPEFERIYVALKGWTVQVPGYTRDADSFITKEVTAAYKEMEARHLSDVKGTKL